MLSKLDAAGTSAGFIAQDAWKPSLEAGSSASTGKERHVGRRMLSKLPTGRNPNLDKSDEELVERDAAEAASAVVAPRPLPEDLGDVDLDQMNEDEVRIWLDAVGVGSADYPPKPDGWEELYLYAWAVYGQLTEVIHDC